MGNNIWVLIPLLALSIPIVAIIAGVTNSILKERYRAQQAAIGGDAAERLQELTRMADSLTERVVTLEAILDAEVPGWRDDHDQHQR